MIDINGVLDPDSGVVWELAKWFYVVAFGLYLVFSLIVWKQIALMAKTLNGSLGFPLKVLGVVISLVAMVGVGLAVVVL